MKNFVSTAFRGSLLSESEFDPKESLKGKKQSYAAIVPLSLSSTSSLIESEDEKGNGRTLLGWRGERVVTFTISTYK